MESAITYLERDGNTTLYVRKLANIAGLFLKIGTGGFLKRISRNDQAELLSNMALMLRSGVVLTTALDEAAESTESAEIRDNLKEMVSSLQHGSMFSESARQYPQIFPDTVIHLIRIGEETGNLDKMLQDAAGHLKNIQKIVSDTKQALFYPAIVLFALFGGFLFWFYYVVPKIVGLFEEMDVTLPPITVFLLNVSNFVQTNIGAIIAGFFIFIIASAVGVKRNRQIKKTYDMALLRLPVAKHILTASNLAFITEYFSLLISSGMDLLRSVDIIRDSVRNQVYKEKMEVVRQSLTRGVSISQAFSDAVIFPTFVVRMINFGEMSGSLTEQLTMVAEEYRNKLSLIVATIGKAIEPVVLLLAGVLFAIIIIGLLLPIYDLIGKISM